MATGARLHESSTLMPILHLCVCVWKPQVPLCGRLSLKKLRRHTEKKGKEKGMELRVAGHEVLLTLNKSYCSEDESSVLQAVAKFKPLVDYLTKLSTEGFQLSTLTVKNVRYIAQRIVYVTFDALVASIKTRDTVSQTITLSDDVLAAYLPVVTCNGISYALLVEQKRIPCGGASVVEAFNGVQLPNGNFSGPTASLLSAVNIPVEGLKSLTTNDIVVGNEGTAPTVFLSSTKEVSEAELAQLQNASSEDGAKVVVIPLEDVIGTTVDVKAAVAAALILQN